jgi:hypothetical protein
MLKPATSASSGEVLLTPTTSWQSNESRRYVRTLREDSAVTERDRRSRYQWLPSALPVLFGSEPDGVDPWPGLLDVVSKFGALTTEIRHEAVREVEGLGTVGEDLFPTTGDWRTPLADVQDLRAPMRVVLMGRTMAGKSSLLTALTGSHFDRIGDGRQRFSRDTFAAAIGATPHIEVVDTPGVGAHGGTDDTEVAFKAALDADVIVWVNSSDSIQEESAAALRLLGVIGKPIIVALNCRQSLQGVGRVNLLRFPDRVFGNKEGLVSEIRRHMAEAGVEPLEVVYVHALAAAEALWPAETAPELHAASRIAELTEALVREHAAHSETRRALRLVDGQRQQAEQLGLSLLRGSAALRAQSERDRGMTCDVHTRLERAVRVTGEALISDVEAAVGRRRDWHLNVTDFGESLQSHWKVEVAALQDELGKSLESRLSSLTTELKVTVEEADTEWESVSPDQFALHNLAGFDAVWGNRLVRAGVGIGGTLAVLGVGALVGGPPGFAIALIGSAVSGVALKPLKNLANRIFLGKDGVLHKRRTEVASQVGPILDQLALGYQNAIAARLDELRDSLARERARSDQHSASLDRVSSRWTRHSENLRELVQELDRETTSALLRVEGRERLARSVKRATRVPGVCILAEFEGTAFWESWLYPPDLGEKLAGGKIPVPGAEAAGALSNALSLVEAPVKLRTATTSSAVLTIHADVPTAITETWSEALAVHTTKTILIETSGRTSTK